MRTPIERLVAWIAARGDRMVACGECETQVRARDAVDAHAAGGPFCSDECSIRAAAHFAL